MGRGNRAYKSAKRIKEFKRQEKQAKKLQRRLEKDKPAEQDGAGAESSEAPVTETPAEPEDASGD